MIFVIREFSNIEIVATESGVTTKQSVGLCFCLRLFRNSPERYHGNQFLKCHGTYGWRFTPLLPSAVVATHVQLVAFSDFSLLG